MYAQLYFVLILFLSIHIIVMYTKVLKKLMKYIQLVCAILRLYEQCILDSHVIFNKNSPIYMCKNHVYKPLLFISDVFRNFLNFNIVISFD